MKLQALYSLLLATGAIAAPSSAPPLTPLSRRQTANIDPAILQYALTLEHLENVFYKNALSKWSQEEFVKAGFTPFFYSQLKYVAHDEEAHVVYLTEGLKAAGASPVAACTYKFPMTDPKEFVALSSVIEGVGVSAYLGAAAGITSKAYLTAAGAILVTEALHQSAARGAVGKIPAANVVGTPLGLNAVFTIASQFIVSCPSTNVALPVKAYPALTVVTGQPTAQGNTLQFSTTVSLPATYYFTFVSGLDIFPVAASSLSAAVPAKVEGQSYVFITTDGSGNVTDATVLAGPAPIEVTPSSPTFDVTIL
ncbi:MAG: hypothetical protein M1814_004603 [Vezdaea aestivalis]|nr:MAG: hypothetical protein M1814_004603 [Vezdaea aestivalis]